MPVTPEVQLILDFLESMGPPGDELSATELRESYAALSLVDSVADMASVSDRVVPSPAGDIPVRVYVPTTEPGPRPVLVYLHGGGWVIGSVDTHDGTARAIAEGSGVTVVSVDYRLAPEHPFPAALDDSLAAVQWVVDNAADLDVDPSRLAVGGDSAGGNLAAVASQQFAASGGPDIRFQLLVYPATDGTMSYPSVDENAEGYFLTKKLMAWFWEQYVGTAAEPTDVRLSPLHAPADALVGLPPALVITAEFDPLRDEGEAYAARLREVGVDATAARYDGVIHGFFSMRNMIPEGKAAVDQACEALRTALA
jgi:acetyl esterase